MQDKKQIKDPIYCLNTGHFPLEAVYVPNRKAWTRFLRERKVSLKLNPYPETAGCVTFFEHRTLKTKAAITFCDELKDYPADEIAGLVVHECMHVVQCMNEEMEEQKPGHEFEAYLIQSLVQEVLIALEDEGIFTISAAKNGK